MTSGARRRGSRRRRRRPAWWQVWWKRLLAGAAAVVVLASAVSGVIALWPDPPPVQAARFTSTPTLRYPIPLDEYQQTVLGKTTQSLGTLTPSGRADPVQHPIQQAAAPGSLSKDLLTASSPASPVVEPLEAEATAATVDPSPTSSSSTSSSSTSSSSTSSSSTSTPTGTGSATASPEKLLTVTPTQRKFIVEDILPRARAMAPELALPPFVVPQPGGSDPMVTFARYAMVDDEGAEISAEAAAQRLVQVFRDIRPAKTGTGEQGQGQRPSGVVIDVNVELEGLRGTPVFLRWSLLNQDGEQQLLGSWLRSVVAQRLVATSEKDTAAVEVWVPLPARSGSYVVRLELTTKNQGEAPLAAILTEPFE